METPRHQCRRSVRRWSDSRRAGVRSCQGWYSCFGNRQELAFLTPTIALLGGEYLLLAVEENTCDAPRNYTEYSIHSDSTGKISVLHLSAPNGFSITRNR